LEHVEGFLTWDELEAETGGRMIMESLADEGVIYKGLDAGS